ncbi:FkbM family methyltransferase [Streptomyces sp. H27-H5]|uniref:FkbM family methyltransferase n=1 Tax=Streptomyces sp. H27-H5 TaxID=2996460 RepID=UPI00226FD776|nr:FkbM family methyltransferase [Streptomyces sp. H27-H5]MCY0963354.1 FkbM family methyltransferase [Streptomyces sp. H27-H5]
MTTILAPTHNPRVLLHVRPDRPADFVVLREVWCEDVYHVHDRIRDAHLVVDVGANIGSFTCFALEMAPQACVVSIEPEPHNLELLRMNINRVDPLRCMIITEAVSDFTGKATINDDAGGSRLGAGGAEVTVKPLDILLEDRDLLGKPIDILKIDIEGSEVPVVLNMSRTLQESIKFLCMELEHNSGCFGQLLEKLSETHKLTTLGAASRGAQLFCERY